MNITLLANKDVASCLALNYLFKGLQEHRLTVFLSSRVGSKPLPPALRQLKFVEQDLFTQLLFPRLGKRCGGNFELLGFDQLADSLAGGLQELNGINQGEGLERFKASEPELVLSIRYGVILKQAPLAIPRHGVLNLHSGRLPDYKGVMATFWALLRGDKEIGTTLHFIDDPSIDTGPIVASSSVSTDERHSYLWHVLSLYEQGCANMLDAVATLDAGTELNAAEQKPGGDYFSFPTESELQLFAQRGWLLWSPKEIENLVDRFLTAP